MEFPINQSIWIFSLLHQNSNHGKNSMENDGVLQSSGVNISHDK